MEEEFIEKMLKKIRGRGTYFTQPQEVDPKGFGKDCGA